MSFLFLISILTAVAYAIQRMIPGRTGLQAPMRIGMACGFFYTGIDHFLSASTRYVPMIPDALANHAYELVWITGVLELLGAIGLLIPLSIYRRLSLPNLRYWAGAGLALLLCIMVAANINVAVKGTQVAGLDFGPWYYWTRPLFQPIFVVWALYAGNVWPRRIPEG